MKYVKFLEFDTKRGKDFFVAMEKETALGKRYYNMRGGLWYMQNVEVCPCVEYKSLEVMQNELFKLYAKEPFNAKIIEPEYL